MGLVCNEDLSVMGRMGSVCNGDYVCNRDLSVRREEKPNFKNLHSPFSYVSSTKNIVRVLQIPIG
jgi:hypothetical protein